MSQSRATRWLRAERTLSLMLLDGLALATGYLCFAVLRYDAELLDVGGFSLLVGLAIVLQWSIGWVARVYRGRTLVASIEETVGLTVITIGVGASVSLLNVCFSPYLVSRSLAPGATFMALFVMIFARALWRSSARRSEWSGSTGMERALVFGAGSGGQQLVRSMQQTPDSPLRPVGMLDDDTWKRHLRVAGVPVLGSRGDIAAAAATTGATVLVIAIPTANTALIRELAADAKKFGLSVKILPGLGEMLTSRVSLRDVRDININDLLGRGAIETDIASIAGYLDGQRVLVTGAGGSIGSELCRQIVRWNPAELIMLDRDESALHAVQLSINGRALLDSKDVVLADIRDATAVKAIFADRRPQVVFHAAALKHLPMLEQYPCEAMKTNVLGTINVLQAAAASGVERFINISTDKAADPISVLGYSKRICERVTAVVAADTPGTYLSVRFGNVLGSRGSVLTSFAAQIAAGGPVTVTHPDVSRYFMTVQEAVQLVLQSAAIGRDGEALILDMGEPVNIASVARKLIELSGEDIDVVFTGLRGAEKMHEALLGTGETDLRPVHPLVSHVAVPEMRLRELLTAPVDLPAKEMILQLRAWSSGLEPAFELDHADVRRDAALAPAD